MRRVGVILAVVALLFSSCTGNAETADVPPTTISTSVVEDSPSTVNAEDAVSAAGEDSFAPHEFIECGLVVPVPGDPNALDEFPSPTAGELAGIAVGTTDVDLGPPEDWALLEPDGVVYRHPLIEGSDAILIMAAGSGPGLCVPEGEPGSAAPFVCVASGGWNEVGVLWFGPVGATTVDVYRNGELLVGDFASNGNNSLPSDLDWAIDDLFVEFGNPPLSWVRPFDSQFQLSGAFSDFTAPVGDLATYKLKAQLNGVRSVTIPCGEAGIATDVALPECLVSDTDGFPTFSLEVGRGGFGPLPSGLWRDDVLVVLPLGGSTSMADVSGVEGVTYTYELSVDLGRGRGERRVGCGEVTIGAAPSPEVQLNDADIHFGATWSSPYWYSTMLVDGVEYNVQPNPIDLSLVDVSPPIENPQALDVMSLFGDLRRLLAEGRDIAFEFHPENGAPVFWSIDGVLVEVLCIEFSEIPPEQNVAACGENNLLDDR